MIDPILLQTLKAVYQYPTAPFNEYLVEGAIIEYCIKNNISYQSDQLGMLWVNKNNSPNLLVSHLDHPGIAIKSVLKNLAIGDWLGGRPKYLVGSVVKVFNDLKEVNYGTIIKRKGNEVTIYLDEVFDAKAGSLWFEELAPKGFQIKGNLLYTHAADDLIIVAGLLATAKKLKSTILFTRAEEFHLSGITELLSKHKLNNHKQIIVLDTTMETDNIPLGCGILLRKGDSEEMYTPEMTSFLKRKLGNTRHVESIVKKGQTEGSAFVRVGLNTGSLGIAVRHIHNKNYEKEPKTPIKPTPEIIDLNDLSLVCSFLKNNF